jgi:U3 small nucleolar RNA-associated protein 10
VRILYRLRSFSHRHRRRVTEYLLSHVTSCGLPVVKLFLVGLLEGVSGRVKVEALLPTIQAFMDKERAPDRETLFGLQFEELVTATISAFDSSVSGHLNDPSSTLWPIFLDAIRLYFLPGMYPLFGQVKFLTHPRITHTTERGSFQQFAKRPLLPLVS